MSNKEVHPFFKVKSDTPPKKISSQTLTKGKGKLLNTIKKTPPPGNNDAEITSVTEPALLTVPFEQTANTDFNFYGSRKHKTPNDFNRIDKKVYGTGHITYRTLEKQSSDIPSHTKTDNVHTYIQWHQDQFFNDLKFQREKQKHTIQRTPQQNNIDFIHNKTELETWLDSYFPSWRKYMSCLRLVDLAFSNKQRDSQKSWTDKYRPSKVTELLGEQHNTLYLKDWLHHMKLNPISAPEKNGRGRKKTKKKMRMNEYTHSTSMLDNYSTMDSLSVGIYADYDDDDDDFCIAPPSKKPAKKKDDIQSNILLIVGEEGVGKTASVYTAAEELGYEVFEISPSSRRSGKDMVSMVGEMTRSHLVHFSTPSPTPTPTKEESPSSKIKKRKLNPTLSQNHASNNSNLMKNFLRPAVKERVNPSPDNTKQSVILLEEVDLLFEEDKGFWAYINELSQKSKRPIIMTCNDPDQIPLETLSLEAVLDIEPPPDTELLPYLWLLCFLEGYFVDPKDLVCLMVFIGRDIRQLIQILEYYKNEDMIFAKYLGLNSTMSLMEMKAQCPSSRLAVDTFRLVQCYMSLYNPITDSIQDGEDSLDVIVRALDVNGYIDSYLDLNEERKHMAHYVTDEDAITGYLTIVATNDSSEHVKLNQDIISSISVLNSSRMKSEEWSNHISDAESHWEDLSDARYRMISYFLFCFDSLILYNN
ncbi:P-loop containing nucleoside triphosphate hydrolase protein [Pilobolus umbonatus]|nr:P-loop containing nucleoside triphosphate hydrolase protein [Pilobolus umbonatus]